jgi:hypothetical protein
LSPSLRCLCDVSAGNRYGSTSQPLHTPNNFSSGFQLVYRMSTLHVSTQTLHCQILTTNSTFFVPRIQTFKPSTRQCLLYQRKMSMHRVENHNVVTYNLVPIVLARTRTNSTNVTNNRLNNKFFPRQRSSRRLWFRPDLRRRR